MSPGHWPLEASVSITGSCSKGSKVSHVHLEAGLGNQPELGGAEARVVRAGSMLDVQNIH